MRSRTIVLQTAMGAYRQQFLQMVREVSPCVEFLVGDAHFNESVTSAVSCPNVTPTGENRFFFGRRFGMQRQVWTRAIAAKRCVLELNPRSLDTWVVIIVRRLLKRPTAVWGHAWPRNGRGARSDVVRHVVRRLASHVICYTYSDAADLTMHYPNMSVSVAPNALYRAQDIFWPETRIKHQFVWIGRLADDKKPRLMIEGFKRYAVANPEARLIFVGDGPELLHVRQAVNSAGLDSQVMFTGWVNDPAQLRALFGSSVANVSTGYVGLNVTQSIGFGCPVIYPREEPHAPEVSVLDDSNSFQFAADSPDALCHAMHFAYRQVDVVNREAISASIRARFSVEKMARSFVLAIEAM